jgi:hypothetical protein
MPATRLAKAQTIVRLLLADRLSMKTKETQKNEKRIPLDFAEGVHLY